MSDEEDDEALLQLARAIVEGESIPWNDLDHSHPALDPSLRGALQDLHQIASVRRTPLDSRPFIPSRWAHLTVLEAHRDGEPRFIARDEGLGREVILTLIGPLDGDVVRTEQLLHQARSRTRIHHPNLATLHGADYSQDRVGYWMDNVKGQPLDELVDRRAVFSPSEACQVALDVGAALEALHAERLPHGSVSAQQAVRGDDGRTILLSSVCVPGSASDGPGPAPCTLDGDVFDLGALLTTLLLGKDTAGDRSPARIGQDLREKRPDVPARLIAAIERCLHPDPHVRFKSAAEFSAAIRAATADGPLNVEWVVGAAVVALITGILLWMALAGS